jgi:hypothetical protein
LLSQLAPKVDLASRFSITKCTANIESQGVLTKFVSDSRRYVATPTTPPTGTRLYYDESKSSAERQYPS